MKKESNVLYVCDGRRERCSQSCRECGHTSDIVHAKNFKKEQGTYVEKREDSKMDTQEIIERLNEAYKQGFTDGFEYGSGKVHPYYAEGAEIVMPALKKAKDISEGLLPTPPNHGSLIHKGRHA